MSEYVANRGYQVVRLRDGRQLSYAQYGDPSGFPVLYAHGGLACRLDVAAAAPVAKVCKVRVISPDRPGVGRSDPQPGRTILDWARDVTELLDRLDVNRFAVMGWSLGGQYAAAVSHALPQRVTRSAIIAGAIPLTESGAIDDLPAIDRGYIRMSCRTPWLARLCFRVMGLAAVSAPRLYGWLAARELGTADAAVLGADGFTTFAQMSREAMRQPQGVVEEYRAMMRPWGFAPEDIQVPVGIWAGTDDQLLDRSWPDELARRIPHATLYRKAGGHFLAQLYYRDIIESLCG
ncbi:alpha/beta fold hydrolase [Mycobacterium montefiorense]|uniref:alpha/beta fold hydrolase n=1 Tax=Mycobacterium montefiorense TaxID=154654 RepID=UPI0021DE2676|nr:alpha/beta hydrolase [Mycobacterium montefiorense]MCV7427326.1 alpha/beta hydrolase [Mycobacterium montefiorense]GLE53835.1 alpha/beta hydrolase [Mycobacterium montefiorense]